MKEKLSKIDFLKYIKNSEIKLATVSGVLTTKPALITLADREYKALDFITTKSYQVTPNTGNREPIIVETSLGSYGNAVGLRNPGMEKGFQEISAISESLKNSYLIISLSGSTAEEFITLIKKFESIADIMELNFSCPHASSGYGASIGADPLIVADFIKKIRTKTDGLIFPKLTPNVDDIGLIAKIAIENGADGITAINTVGPEIYYEQESGRPILANPKGHKGGKSGEWIKEIALEKISQIRSRIGQAIPIIGMGGVSTPEDVKNMREAGADIIGIGSAIAPIATDKRAAFFSNLKNKNKSNIIVNTKPLAKYITYTINKIIDKTDTLRIIELDGTLEYEAGQFVFLWLSSLPGEKPFAIANNNPLTFVIRKRAYDPERKLGLVTHALFQLKTGEKLALRGSYGKGAPYSDKKNNIIVAGGSGIAIVPALVKELFGKKSKTTVYYGIKIEQEKVFEELISPFAEYLPVADDGEIGRVLKKLKEDLKEIDYENSACYNMGPLKLMQIASKIEQDAGIADKNIYFSLETNTMCGIGICGECVCGNKLTCKDGTFVNLAYLKNNNISLDDLEQQ